MLCPFKWLGEWQRVYGDRLGDECKKSNSHARWQSQANGLSDNRRARNRGIPVNISRGIAVMLLLFSVLMFSFWHWGMKNEEKREKKEKEGEKRMFWLV